MSPLDQLNREILLQILQGNTTSLIGPIQFPLIFSIPTDDNPSFVNEFERNANFDLRSGASSSYWEMVLSSEESSIIPFLTDTSSYRIIVWSQEASQTAEASLISTDPGTIILYLMVIATLGFILRYFAISLPDTLWIKRMDHPQEIYRMIISVNAFRAARDLEKEKEITDQLLNTLRSREYSLKLTTN